MASIMLLAAYGVAALLFYASLLVLHQFTYWKRRKVLHLELVPIIGNMAPIMFRTSSFPIHSQNMYKKYPGARYYGFFDLQKPSVIIKDPDLIREIFVKSFDHFTDHDAFVTEEMDPIVGRNIFSLRGQRWKEVRNTLTPSYTAARMKMLFALVAECSKDFVQYFVDHPELAENFEAKDAITRYTNDVVASAAFGVKVNSMKDQDNEFYLHGKEFTNVSALAATKLTILQNFPNIMKFFGTTFLSNATDKFFKKLITNTVTTRIEKGITRQDMMQLLIEAMKKDDGLKVTMDDIIGQAFFFFLAGFESTSSAMCFALQELAANPDIQDRLRQEIDDEIEQHEGELTYESLANLKYLDMVMSETLRKYPPVAITNRLCNKEYTFPPLMEGYPEYQMEVGTSILISMFGLQRDPKYFPDPEKFDPERFNDKNKHKINPYTYMPFGIGPRQCIANRFALMEAKIVIIDILRKFVVKFTEKSHHPVTLSKKTFILSAEEGFWFKFEGRKKVD
ncbi:hypothetical protein TSAR_009898 [Trichomalopsis sarcophagae]|uniref:Cytochrome P450 n=1 Tax=Trichomalopsis sarcophagae TaxID=543379 RepID=A0A232EJW7_9HYME|nr:hypothetical protein TSAR_009898 [Trichomalopsis sarcophagae]